MLVSDMNQNVIVHDPSELARALTQKYGAVNHFWLFHEGKYPAMSILVKDDLASLHYFSKERVAGFRSVGHVPGLSNGGLTVFAMENPEQEERVPNEFVVPLSTALAAATDFLRSKERPSCVEWFEL